MVTVRSLPSSSTRIFESSRAVVLERSPITNQGASNGGVMVNLTVSHHTHPDGPSEVAPERVTSMHEGQPDRSPTNPTALGTVHKTRAQVYYDSLLPEGRGSPLYTPAPDRNLPKAYRREGVCPGDIVIINRYGGASYLFNIFAPAEDPINLGRVPASFRSFPKALGRTETYPLCANVLMSSSVQSSAFSSDDIISGLGFETSHEGALVAMPSGGTSTFLVNTMCLEKYVQLHCESWYQFVLSGGRPVENGDIRLVVSCDKTTAWGMATFLSNEQQRGQVFFKKLGSDNSSAASYMPRCFGSAAAQTGPQVVEMSDLLDPGSPGLGAPIENQCLFIQTMNPRLSMSIFEEIVQSVEESGWNAELEFDAPQMTSQVEILAGAYMKTSIDHPSLGINLLLSQKFPCAKLVITEDKHWMSLVKKREQFPRTEELMQRMETAYTFILDGDVVKLRDLKLLDETSQHLNTDTKYLESHQFIGFGQRRGLKEDKTGLEQSYNNQRPTPTPNIDQPLLFHQHQHLSEGRRDWESRGLVAKGLFAAVNFLSSFANSRPCLTPENHKQGVTKITLEEPSEDQSHNFIENGYQIDARDLEQPTITLAEVIRAGVDLRVVHQALEDGADANGRDSQGRLPIYFAIATGDRKCVEALLHYGASLSGPETSGRLFKAVAGIVSRAAFGLSIFQQTPATQAFEALCLRSAEADAEELALVLLRRRPQDGALELGNPDNRTSLFHLFWTWAVCNGYCKVIRILVEERGAPTSLLKTKIIHFDMDAQRPIQILDICASQGHLELFKYLLVVSSQQNLPLYSETELSHALALHVRNRQKYEGNLDMARCLIEAGASCGARCEEGKTALAWACQRPDSHDLVVLLLSSRGNEVVNIPDDFGQTPLHSAVWYFPGFYDTMRSLLQHGADINAVDNQGRTPLWYAVSLSGSAGNVAFLLESGADVDLRGCDTAGMLSSTPLMEGCLRTAHEDGLVTVATLMAYGADVNAPTDSGTPLISALQGSHEDLAQTEDLVWMLLQAGANPLLDNSPIQPLVEAAKASRNGGDSVFEVLRAIQRKSEGRIPRKLLDAAVVAAIGNNDQIRLDVLVAFMLAGFNPRQSICLETHNSGVAGQTVLHCIAGSGIDVRGSTKLTIRYLLHKGARLSDVDHNGRTPLHIAAKKGKQKVVDEFLACGAVVDAVDLDGATPLTLACQTPRNMAGMGTYTANRQDSFFSSARGEHTLRAIKFALWEAAQEIGEFEGVVHLLREAGADLGVKDRKGLTPLHHACRVGNHVSVGVLLGYRKLVGATSNIVMAESILAVDGEGKTALHWAAISGNVEVVRMVLTAILSSDSQADITKSTRHALFKFIGQRDLAGNTALFYAVEHGWLDVAKVFLKGIKVHGLDEDEEVRGRLREQAAACHDDEVLAILEGILDNSPPTNQTAYETEGCGECLYDCHCLGVDSK